MDVDKPEEKTHEKTADKKRAQGQDSKKAGTETGSKPQSGKKPHGEEAGAHPKSPGAG